MYKILPQQSKSQVNDFPTSETASSASNVPPEFLSQAVFAGESFWALEAAYAQAYGVVKTVTGYCGGTLRKPAYREVCERRTGHTEAVKVMYDIRKTSYRSLCDAFWGTHDPTSKEFLNFGISTHRRSVIFYGTEGERREAQESKIRRQMKLNRRIVTKIIPSEGVDFFIAENQHQKYHLQKHYRLCESLSLRSTEQFAESNIACLLNGILAMDGEVIIDELATFIKSHHELSKKAKLACEEIIEDLRRIDEKSHLKTAT